MFMNIHCIFYILKSILYDNMGFSCCTSIKNSRYYTYCRSNGEIANNIATCSSIVAVDQSFDQQAISDITKRKLNYAYDENALNESQADIIIISPSDDERDDLTNHVSDITALGSETHRKNKHINRYYPYTTNERPRLHKKPEESFPKAHFYIPITHSDNIQVEEKETSNFDNRKSTNNICKDNPLLGYTSDGKSTISTAIIESKSSQKTYLHSQKNSETSGLYSSMKISKMTESPYEAEKKTLKSKLTLLKEENIKKIINTAGKKYSMFSYSEEKEISYADIQIFISGDFYIEFGCLQEDLTNLIGLINCVAKNEQRFWEKSDNTEHINNLVDQMLDCSEKLNFCIQKSKLFTFCPGLVHIKHFVQNIILNDKNLVKKSCLLIILLKLVQSLSRASCNEMNLEEQLDKNEKKLSQEDKDSELYHTNNKVFRFVRSLYGTFDVISKYIFLNTEIFPESAVMLDYMEKCLKYCDMDLQTSADILLDFNKIIVDSILGMSPKAISIFVLQLKKHFFTNLNGKKFSDASNFFKDIFQYRYILSRKDVWDFKNIFKEIILAYIDFFEKETRKLDFSCYRDIILLKRINSTLKSIFRRYDIKKANLEYIDLSKLMKFAESLCIFFNLFMKVGLKNEAYSETYIKTYTSFCIIRIDYMIRFDGW